VTALDKRFLEHSHRAPLRGCDGRPAKVIFAKCDICSTMKYLLSLLLLLTLCSSAFAEPKHLEAKFLGIEIGDYYHINVEDADGNQRSFFLSDDESFDPFIKDPESHKGDRVDLLWHTIEKDIPEAGGKMTIDEAISIIKL
jgi:hypothetical protein